MKQLYTLNPDIKSSDEFLEAYNKSTKTDNLLKDLCNILFVNPKPYVRHTIYAWLGTMVPRRPIEVVVQGMWRLVTGEWTYKFSHKVETRRWKDVRDMLHIRYIRNLDPESKAEYEEIKQRIIADLKK
jgi:hypothetical protein